MKVLVTGADGFIGSHLTEALVHAGHEVRALSQYNSINSNGWLDSLSEDVLEEVDIVPGDVRDRSQMMAIIRGRDAVLHSGIDRHSIFVPSASIVHRYKYHWDTKRS